MRFSACAELMLPNGYAPLFVFKPSASWSLDMLHTRDWPCIDSLHSGGRAHHSGTCCFTA